MCIDNPHLPTFFNLFYDQMKDADYPYTQPLSSILRKKTVFIIVVKKNNTESLLSGLTNAKNI